MFVVGHLGRPTMCIHAQCFRIIIFSKDSKTCPNRSYAGISWLAGMQLTTVLVLWQAVEACVIVHCIRVPRIHLRCGFNWYICFTATYNYWVLPKCCIIWFELMLWDLELMLWLMIVLLLVPLHIVFGSWLDWNILTSKHSTTPWGFFDFGRKKNLGQFLWQQATSPINQSKPLLNLKPFIPSLTRDLSLFGGCFFHCRGSRLTFGWV